MKLFEYNYSTNSEGMYNITKQAAEAVSKSGVIEGICVVFCPHTTAGIT
ncbi:MAG: YjbQ family protein, partial [Ruminiclostridium sp.]